MFQSRELRVVDVDGCRRRNLTLDRAARLDQFERADIVIGGACAGRFGTDDIDARTGANLDQALYFQRDNCFANGGARHVEQFGKIAFGGHPLVQRIGAGCDLLAQMLRNLLV